MSARRHFLHGFIAVATGICAVFGIRAASASIEDEIEFYDLGKGQEKATQGRERALEKGRGKGLEKAPPMSPPAPPPTEPPPTTPPPGL